MKSLAIRLIRLLGWESRRYDVNHSEWLRLLQALRAHGVTVVLDVGANSGQFGSGLRRAGFRGRMISFEPLSAAHAELIKRARRDTKWLVAPRVALSDHDGIMTMNVSNNSVSSSVLPMTSAHLKANPTSGYVRTEDVRCARLDELAVEYLGSDDRAFLKVDVQGYEATVLSGAEALLSKVACVHLELSLQRLYDGQPLYSEMIQLMTAKGFALWGLEPGFVDPNSGKMLQVDGLFCRLGDTLD